MAYDVFGTRLRQRRQEKGMTQHALGRELGVTDKAVSRWETGTARPRGALLARLSAVLDISVDTLLGNLPGAPDRGRDDGDSMDALPPPPPTKKKGIRHMKHSFIPETAKENGNYLCTWTIQEDIAKKEGHAGNGTLGQRDAMDAAHLFAPDSPYHFMKREDLAGLYLLLDDGWDVPYHTAAGNWRKIGMFGSVEPDAERFAGYGETPEERLLTLSQKAKEWGYAGLGLWISPQKPFTEEENDPAEIERYWESRARMCEAAGVRYWKVDWGKYADNPTYREHMTTAVHRVAPHLRVEHAVCQGPYSGTTSPDDEIAEKMRQVMPVSDYLRTYDVQYPFADAATACRVDALLSRLDPKSVRPDCLGKINVESRPAVAAGLGCNLGIMRYRRETEAVLRWQRLAPPFSVKDAPYLASTERLTDSYYFSYNPDWWLPNANTEYSIRVPAVMARGTRLPVVHAGGAAPILLASENPETGAYAVSALRRTIDPNPMMIAAADVTIYPSSLHAPIGIFGYYTRLTIVYPEPIPARATVFAECLLSDSAFPVTEGATISGNTLTLDGKWLRYAGIPSREAEALCEPALLITIR